MLTNSIYFCKLFAFVYFNNYLNQVFKLLSDKKEN